MAKIRLEDIQQQLPEGWEIRSTEYQNLDTEMEFVCNEGHSVYSTWKKLRSNPECPVCKQNEFKNLKDGFPTKKKGTYRTLALDQASKVTGWSVYDGKQLIKYGIFTATGDDEVKRFLQIKNWLFSMITNWQPDIIGIEGIQYEQNFGVTTFQTLARLQGIIMVSCEEVKIPHKVCPTNTWRAHCGVKGRSRTDKKKSMQLLVKNWFDITVTDDVADAIGIGKYIAETWAAPKEIESWM